MMSPEQEAREKIDELLRECGWNVQDYLQYHPSVARGIALREVPVKGGRCDYLLIVDRKPVGIIEAKKAGTTLSSVAEQSGFYGSNLPDLFQTTEPLAFYYESTGVETFFRDARDPDPRSRRVFAFHRPETLAASLAESGTLRSRLTQMPFAHPLVKTGMRDCQVEAITNLEQSFAAAHSRSLIQMATGAGTLDRRDVIATVFKGTINRMINGYLLRDVIAKVDALHFNSTEELHTLGHLYESLLREMRDAAGDSGEFYTPRAVVRFMVAVTDPRLGESVLDPACGTGGFLVEAYQHLAAQCKTVAHHRTLQSKSIFGGEAKSLPYLLAQMNLLLHGLEAPQIRPGNSLEVKLTELGERDRVDVILTNPPFGGEEERGILSNFPEDKRTAETALLFLQLIMRKLRRGSKPGRAAVVVPNGTLFGDGVCARIKEELLKAFNLHTIVRLPNGVFAPYTGIPTNILFFDRTGPTKEVWYYEQPLPEGRKNYTKTQPIQFEEFAPCVAWWNKRKETEHAWRVPAAELLAAGCNLDRKNPNAKEDITHLPPEQLVASILAKEKRITEIMGNIQKLLAKKHA